MKRQKLNLNSYFNSSPVKRPKVGGSSDSDAPQSPMHEWPNTNFLFLHPTHTDIGPVHTELGHIDEIWLQIMYKET